MGREELKKEICEYLKVYGVKDSSASTYGNNVLRMVKELYGGEFELKQLEESDKIVEYMEGLSIESGKQVSIAVGVLMLSRSMGLSKEVQDRYEDMYKRASGRDAYRRQEREWRYEKEPEEMWEEIKGNVRMLIPPPLEIKTNRDLRRYMNVYIGMLYTLHPPIRHGEWISSVLVDGEGGKRNHVNLLRGELVIYDQKSGKMSVRRSRLCPRLVEKMREMDGVMRRLYGENERYVLPKYDKGYGKADSTTVSDKIGEVLGYKLNEVRKIYEGVVYKNGSSDTYLYVVNALGHTVDTSKKDYVKGLKRGDKEWEGSDHFSILEEKMHDQGRKIVMPKMRVPSGMKFRVVKGEVKEEIKEEVKEVKEDVKEEKEEKKEEKEEKVVKDVEKKVKEKGIYGCMGKTVKGTCCNRHNIPLKDYCRYHINKGV